MSGLQRVYYKNIKESLYKSKLDNGLSLYIINKPNFKEKAAFLSVKFGSVDNQFYLANNLTASPAGVAHFLEHKLFEDEQGSDITLDFVNIGADVNAYTTFDCTNYYFSTLNCFEEALELLSKFTQRLTINPESIEREKHIIGHEIDMYQDDADYRVYLGCLQNLYPNTALAEDIAGSKESLERIDLENLTKNFQYFYTPSNCRLVLIGDFNVEDVYNSVKKIQRKFTGVDNKKLIREDKLFDVSEVLPSNNLHMDVTLPKLAVGFKSSRYSGTLLREKLLMRLYFNLLFGWTSPYYQAWYEEGDIDDSFAIELEVSERFAFAVITMDTAEPIRMSSIIRQVIRTSDKDKIFTDKALQLQKNALYGDFVRSFDDIQHLGSQFLEFLADDTNYLDLGAELMSIQIEDVINFAQNYQENMKTTDFTVFPK
ncbi:EF-P 5-aminopentanol modification-associated protein YfmH [Streptococcus dentiloxodontae]